MYGFTASDVDAPRWVAPADADGLGHWWWRPAEVRGEAPLLVLVHGISRDPGNMLRALLPWGRRYGVALLAPLFDSGRFPHYQRLGWYSRGQRADDALLGLLDDLQEVNTRRVWLFGYSGGGQFVHRFAMAYPRRVRAVGVGAAGHYTFPDPERRFPRGLRARSGQPRRLRPAHFLEIPMAVWVGENDGQRDRELRKRPGLDRQQGRTRIERGRRWVAAMRAAAAPGTPYRFELLPGCAHDFQACVGRGGLGPRLFGFLFGPAPPPKPTVNAPFMVRLASIRTLAGTSEFSESTLP